MSREGRGSRCRAQRPPPPTLWASARPGPRLPRRTASMPSGFEGVRIVGQPPMDSIQLESRRPDGADPTMAQMPDVPTARTERFLMSPIRMLAVSGLLTLAAAAPAAADSIAYIKDSNVWLANPDGSHRVQITRDGTPPRPTDHRSGGRRDDRGAARRRARQARAERQAARPSLHRRRRRTRPARWSQDVPQQVAISPDAA